MSEERRNAANGAANIWPFNRPFIAASSKTFTNGTVQISGGANITVGTTGNTITISGNATTPSFSAGVSNVGNTAGSTGVSGTRMVLVGTNNITLSQSTDASGATVSISGGAGGAGGSFSGGVSNLGNTAGSTGVTGTRLVLAGTNMVSLSQSTDANGGTVSINATQSVQTQDVLSVGASTGGNTAGNTTVNTGSRMVFAGVGDITLSQATAAGATTLSISGTQTVQTQDVLSIGLSTGGNTLGNTTVNTGSRMVLVGTNNITLSQGTGAGATTITISGPNTNPSFSAGVSTAGNTAGSTGISGTRMVLVGTNNITLSQSTDANGNTISISGAGGGAGAFSGGVSNLGNTAGSTGITGTRLVLVGTNNVTLSQSTDANGATVSISAAAGGGGAGPTLSGYPLSPFPIATSSMNSGTSGNSSTTVSFYCAPFPIEENLTFNQIWGSASVGTAAGTGSYTGAHIFGLYTLNGGSALSLVSSGIFNLVMSQNSVTARTASWWWGTNSTSNSTSLSGNVSASFTGLRPIPFLTGANSLSASDYWLVHGMTHRTSGASIGGINSGAFLNEAGTTTANLISFFGTNAGRQALRHIGAFSTTSTGTTTGLLVAPASIHTSVITGGGGTSQWRVPLISISSL